MHLAAEQNLVQVVEEFLVNGAEINDKNNRGHTPLHLAAINGHARMVRLLLDKGKHYLFR